MQTATDVESSSTLSTINVDPLAVEAARLLGESGYTDLRKLRCDCHDGVMSIRGHLPSYFLKQMAQTLVSRIDGVRRVSNQILVP